MILSMSFKGDAKDFGWVIPVPGKPAVSKAGIMILFLMTGTIIAQIILAKKK